MWAMDNAHCDAGCGGGHTFAPGCVFWTDLDDPDSPDVNGA